MKQYSDMYVTANYNTTSYVTYEKYGNFVHLKGLFIINTELTINDDVFTLPYNSITVYGIYLRNKSGIAIQCSLNFTSIKVDESNMPTGVCDIDLCYIAN